MVSFVEQSVCPLKPDLLTFLLIEFGLKLIFLATLLKALADEDTCFCQVIERTELQ